MSQQPRGEEETPVAPRRRTERGHEASRPRAVLAAALLAVLAAGLVVAAYLGFRVANPTEEPFNPAAGSVLPSERDRSQAVATAEQFTLRMDNVDGSEFDSYVEGINEMLTAKAQAENAESLEVLQQTYEAAEVEGTGEILLTGISEISEDTATVLVAHDADVTTNQGDIQHFYRWTVDLVKVDGEWRVDGFTPVS